MSLEAMSNTIRATVQLLDVSPIVWDNDPNLVVRQDVVQLRASIRLGEQRQVSTGGVKRFRQGGALVLQVYNPLGKGDQANLSLIDTILLFFRCKTYDGVVFATPTLETVGRNDKYWQVNAICPFYYDILAS
jgi:hypothetical protein